MKKIYLSLFLFSTLNIHAEELTHLVCKKGLSFLEGPRFEFIILGDNVVQDNIEYKEVFHKLKSAPIKVITVENLLKEDFTGVYRNEIEEMLDKQEGNKRYSKEKGMYKGTLSLRQSLWKVQTGSYTSSSPEKGFYGPYIDRTDLRTVIPYKAWSYASGERRLINQYQFYKCKITTQDEFDKGIYESIDRNWKKAVKSYEKNIKEQERRKKELEARKI